MLAIPSLSRNEDTRAGFLFNWLKTEGYTVVRIANNLMVTHGSDPSEASVILNSHIDTVPPGDGWDSDPYLPVRKEGKITGLGSNDAGASVVSLLGAFSTLSAHPKAGELALLITAEEEVSGANGISSLIPLFKNLKFALVGEPTGMDAAVAERGLMVVDAVATGVQGHAARGEGVNAIYKAMEDIERITRLEFSEHSRWLRDPSLNVTVIQAGSKHNVVPGKCEFVIDVRSNDHYSNERLLQILRETCSSEMQERSMRLRSSCLPDEHPVFSLIEKYGMKPFGSPTLSDMALLSVPSLKLGPGHSSRSHTANEYILEDEIKGAIPLYENLIADILNADL